jgi:broad specificity phosphatase PhoE
MTGPPEAASGSGFTVVHLVRHGEVDNPGGIIYGRLPGYGLSDLGREMAERVASSFAGHDVAEVVSSPLDRARQTAQPIADAVGVDVRIDQRLIEGTNHFEGLAFGVGDGSLRHPRHWRYLVNPFRPSWGEPFQQVLSRVLGAVADAREQGSGREVVLVSHQLPIWVTRRYLEGRALWHDPRRRECTLASVTTFTYTGRDLVAVSYSEPAAELLPGASTVAGA